MLFPLCFFFLTACGQKADPAAKASEATKEVTQQTQEAIQQTSKEIPQKVQESAEKISNDAAKAAKEGTAGKEGAKKSAVEVKETAEQALAETVGHAQEVTKTQKSEPRQRGQKAEDEMMLEIEKHK